MACGPRRRWLQPFVLASALLAGCVASRPDVLVSNYEPTEPAPADPATVALFVALAERPVADRYVNHGLWEFADEQTPFIHDLDRKGVLDRNGFRVGVLSGLPSESFLTLLSKRCCPDPRGIRLQPGSPTTVDVGPAWSELQCQVVHKGRPHPVALPQAQCRLQFLPHLDGDDKVRLVVTPQVRHGQQQLTPRPVQDPDGSRRWDVQVRHAEETYPWMNWSITLAAGDYLVIGGRLDQEASLGRRMFLHTETETPVQRVLIVRALRPDPPATAWKKDAVVPLAAQAQGLPGAARLRGSRPE